jgi:hypothetical protein
MTKDHMATADNQTTTGVQAALGKISKFKIEMKITKFEE